MPRRSQPPAGMWWSTIATPGRPRRVAAGLGERAIASSHDVSQWSTGAELVQTCLDRWGRMDGLVNNAGILALAHSEQQTEDDARRLVETNLLGTIACGTAALAHFCEQGSGVMVNVTSGQQMGAPTMAVYGATKAGVAALTYAWAEEFADRDIRVNAISPMAHTQMAQVFEAFMGADFVGQNRDKPPANNAAVVVWLLSDEAQLTGQVVRCDGETLSLCSHPAVISPPATTSGQWTPEAVSAAFAGGLADLAQPCGVRQVQAPRHLG